MIKNVTMCKNVMTIEWDQCDYDVFFRIGLQALADEHFNGERKVIVMPCDTTGVSVVAQESKTKSVEVSDDFADACVGYGVNHALKEYICGVKQLGAEGKCCLRNLAKKKTSISKKVQTPVSSKKKSHQP